MHILVNHHLEEGGLALASVQRSVTHFFTVLYISEELNQSEANNGAHQHSQPWYKIHFFEMILFVYVWVS